MALLGTLTLDLSAPTAQLSRDLDRAQQLAREAASKMSGIKPVWGIASSLQDEMRASRSILNSSLKAIESDVKGYRPMVRVGIEFDSGAIDTQMQSLEREFSHRSAYLNRQVITPQVDDSQLTALNKHLSIKERHLDTVVAKFANTRITPSFDTSQIDRMGAALNSLDRPRSLRIDLPDSIDGIKSALGKLVLSPVSLPIKIAQNVFEGAFEGLGRQLSKNFSKGLSGSIESFITRKVGMSTGDMGKESGKYIARNTYLWGEYVSRAQGYERGMTGVGEDIAKVGGAIDQVANPVKFRRNIRKVENNYVAYQEKRQSGDVKGANEIKEQAIKPFVDGAQTIAKRVAGVGLRIAAQPYRVRKRVRLAQSIEDANQQAKDLEIPNYDREKADQAESINLVMGGIDFNGTRNTAFASRLMGQVLPKGYTVPVTTPFSNTPVEKGAGLVDTVMHGILTKMAGGDPEAVAKMPVSKLLEIAVSKGYNPDAIKAYAHVKKIREMHPDKPINVMGTSGGSAVTEEVISMAERDGDKNVRGLGIGLPFHGLTGTAGKQFKGTIGDLDPLALSAYGTQYTQRKLTPEQVAKLPFSGNGLLAPDRARSAVIPNAGVDHNIGMFSVNQDFQQVARSQLKAFTNPDLVGRQGIVNLNPYVQQNTEDLTIPRTIKAMFGDRQAKKDIVVGGEYAFYQPNHPDWRRDNDFASMKAGVASKVKSTKGLPKEHADEYMSFLDTMHSELTAFYESKGKIKPLKTLGQAIKYYPELEEIAKQNGIKVTGERAFQYREQPQKVAKPVPQPKSVTQTEEPAHDPLKDSTKITAQILARKRDKKTDDPWTDNYREPQLDVNVRANLIDVNDPFASTPSIPSLDTGESPKTNARPKINVRPKIKKIRSNQQSEELDGEFVEQQQLNSSQQFNRSIDSARVLPALEQRKSSELVPVSTQESSMDKVGRGANAGFGAIANTLQIAENLAQTGRDATGAISELAGAAKEGASAVRDLTGAAREGVGAVVELTGAVKEASGAVKNIASAANSVAEALNAAASAVKDRIGVFADKAASDRRIGQAQNLAIEGDANTNFALPGKMRTIQAIESDDTEQMQLGGRGIRLALPPSDDLNKSKDYMKLVEGIFAQKKAAIYQAIESGDVALAKKLNDDYRRNIVKLEGEITSSVKNGDRQTKEFYNSGGIKNQLAHKKRFAENIDIAIDLVQTNASPDEIKQAQIISDANLRKVTARTIANNRNRPSIEDRPAIDVVATPVVDAAPDRFKQTNAKIIGDLLKDRKLKIEQAIEDGDLKLVKAYRQELNDLIQDGRDLIAANPNSASLKSNLSAELTNKEKFGNSAEKIADLMSTGASAVDIDNQPNITSKLKKSAKLGLKSLLIDRIRDNNNEGGFFNLGARITALDFLDTPVQSFRNTVDRFNPFKPRQLTALGNPIAPPDFIERPQLNQFNGVPSRKPVFNPNIPTIDPADVIPQADGMLKIPGIGQNYRSIAQSRAAISSVASPIIPETEKSETALSKLVGVGKLALSVFGGFTALSLGVPAMVSLGKSILDTAKNFETLQVKLAAASDSAQSGKKSFERISGKADELGVSRSSALEVGAGIAGTTFGTELQGSPSDRITDQTLQFFKLRGLNKQQQEGFQLAATQTLGRKNLSGQEVNQFIQSAGITDTRSIAARGMGLTPAQFAAMQDGPGIDSKKFIQAFLSQGVQDARTGEGLASQTASYKESQLGAKSEVLAGTVGAIANPVYKSGVDLLTNSIGLLNSAIANSQSVLIGFAINGLLFAGAGLVKLAIQFGLPAAAMATFKSLIVANAATIGMAMVKLGVQFATFYLLGEGIQLLGKKWSNAGQEIQDVADKVGTALDKVGDKKLPDINKPKTAKDVDGEGFLEKSLLFVQRKVTQPLFQAQQDLLRIQKYQDTGIVTPDSEMPVIADNKQKADREIRDSIDNVSTRVLESKGASERAGKKGKDILEVDRALAAIDTERSGLYASGSPDPIKIAELNKRFGEQTAKRDSLNADTAPAKGAAQEAINAVKSAQSFIDGLNAKGQIGQDTYIEKSAQLKKDLKIAEDAQLKLNQALKSGFDNLTPWLNTLNKIAAKFEEIGINTNTAKERLSIARNNGEISGKLTRGGAERQSVYDTDLTTASEIKSRNAAIKQLRDALNINDANNVTNVQKSYGLSDESSSAQIKIAAGLATTNSDKQTLEKLATIKEEQIKVASLDATLSNSHAETYRRIYAENREAALYYNQLSQQIDPKGVIFAKNISAITAEKARFMAKLQNYGTGGFDVYTTAIIDLMDLAKDRMTALAKLASDKKAAVDAQTNRDNDIAGKRQNDFDVTPGTQQPSVGKVSGLVQNSGTNATQPQSVNPATPNIESVEPPLPPKTIKVKRTRTIVDKSGYTDNANPQIQAQIRAQLSSGQYSPADVDRYLNTTKAIGSRTYNSKGKPTGYTDLGLDEFDRKVLGLNDRGKPQGVPISTVTGKPLRSPFNSIDSAPVTGSVVSTKPQRAKIVVPYEEEIANPEYKKAVDAQNKRKADRSRVTPQTTQSSDRSRVTPQTTQSSDGRMTTGQFRDKSQVASDRITQEAIDRAKATYSEFKPGEALKQNQIRLKLERESRLAQQAAAKQLRDQESTQINAVPAVSIQDTHQRETLGQRNALIDNRESVSNARIDMTSQIQNIEISIAEFNQLSKKKNRTQSESTALQQLKIAVPKLSKDLPILRQALSRLRASEAGLPANDAKAIAALQANHEYQLEVINEREEQDRKSSEINQAQTKLTDIDQQLTNAPLDQNLLNSQFEANKQMAIDRAKMTRIEEDRKVTERERSDARYTPKKAEAARKRNREIEQNTIKNAENKQAQEIVRAKNTIDREFATADIAELKLGQSSGDLGVRFAQSQDKIDAPFVSTRALDLELQQKLSAIENAKIERNKNFEQQRIEHGGTSDANIKLLASLDRQQKEADRQSEVEKKVVETESGIAVRGVQTQRKGYLYGQQKATFSQQIGIYDGQTTGDKQRGVDTREREYTSAVLRKKSEYSQQEFDLSQQRDAITGLTPEAEAARNSIDGLIAGLKEMESIELSNMANQFDRFNQVLGETQKTTQSVLEKFVKTGKFDWKSILRTPLEGGISQIMSKIVPDLFSGLYRKNPVPETQAQPTSFVPIKPVEPIAPTPSAKIEPAVEQIIAQPTQSAITPVTGRLMLDAQGMANIPIPGGGNYRIPRDQAISEGFMRLDGSSTSDPEVKPEIKIAPLEPQTIAAPEVTIEPIPPQTIPAPQSIADDTQFDIQQLPLKGRSNIVNFKPKFDPNLVTPPPMPVNQFEGMPGYVVPKPQQRANSGGVGDLLAMIPGLGSAGKYMGMLGKIGGLFGLGFADGGMVPSDSKFSEFRQGNDPIGAALRKEGANSVIAALTPGERVLTVSESRYYETMFPQGIKGYADGGVVGNIKPVPLNLDQSKIDNRGDSNEFNFDIKNGGGSDAKMTKENLKDMENAVVAVLLKQKRARTGLVPM